MCGIVGIYTKSGYVNEELLIQMRDLMSHRGPDDAGLYISQERKLGLGHRRLSILDLSSAGKQPMSDDSGKIWITYNGEIYNFRELRYDLEKKGYKFRSQTDTEVIIYLYKEYGKDMLHKLRGMFAFGIWDANKEELFLARDRIGIKPLYYTLFNGNFIFASEIKAIIKHPEVKREVDLEALQHYFSFLTTPPPLTLFKGIKKLPSGHTLTMNSNGDLKIEEYWDVFDNVSPLVNKPEEFYTEKIVELLRESVKYRMVSDVPVGIFLSGGIDSSTNVALFSELSRETIRTFSIGFKDQEAYNEFQYARKIAQIFHTDHNEMMIDVDDLVDFLPKLIYYQDEPIADPVCVPMYFLSKMARDNGVIVCQLGEGSDELFCGYPYWKRTLEINTNVVPYLRLVPSFIRKLGLKSLELAGKARSGHYEMLRRVDNKESIFWGGAVAFRERDKKLILSENLKEKFSWESSYAIVKSYYDKFLERSPIKDYLHFMSYIDLRFRLPDLLLTRTDKMSMATSLEVRVPFLDHKFVEFSMSIPQNVKFKNGELKYILKKSVENILPKEIIYRKKQGFDVPIIAWFMERLGDFTNRKLLDFCERTEYLNKQHVQVMLSERDSPTLWYLLNFVL
ncbi:asparagine synthase (glutamine-hydrolyzing), partial [Candidatus Poribacteria bacterium]|nr:asparagine synthase (glutamine-hydrolyzing) [Candidatus Poribacteria bacterium]